MARHYRKVIRIKAEDSPNVKLGLMQQARGQKPTGKVLVPGVLTWDDYVKRRATWDKVRQCIGLDADFYEGAEVLLFPPDWLNRAELLANTRGALLARKCLGMDPAEGGDSSVWTVGDMLGVIHQESMKTPNTAIITGRTLTLMREYNIKPEDVAFDRGGGGKEHADRLRAQGVPVTTVAFGEAVVPELHHGRTPLGERKEEREERYTYVSRRSQMYHEASLLFDPDGLDEEGKARPGYALPVQYQELRRQLAVMPKLMDGEGRYYLPPKTNRNPNSTVVTLTELVGHSPDEADSFVLMVHRLLHRSRRAVAGSR